MRALDKELIATQNQSWEQMRFVPVVQEEEFPL